MLKECIEIFKKEYDDKGEALLTDSYILGRGDYFIVKSNGDYSHIKVDKNTVPQTEENYDYLAQRDYLSGLLSINKPIDGTKKIHSNNYLSFFIKNNVIIENKAQVIKSIKSFYETLKNPLLKYKNDKNKKISYTSIEEEIGKPDEERIDNIQKWIEDNLWKLQEETDGGKEYLKIFFEADIEQYKKENKRYIIPNIYTSTNFNVMIDNMTYGLPNNNLNLNSKKPFLENKTRKKGYRVPYLLNEEDVYMQKNFFDLLFNFSNAGERNIYFSEKGIFTYKDGKMPSEKIIGYYMRIVKDKSEAEIQRFDIINSFEPNLKKKLYIMDYLKKERKSEYSKLNYGSEISKLDEFNKLIDNLIFNKKLRGIIFENIKDLKLKDPKIKYIGNLYKNIFYDLLIKGDLSGFFKIYKKLFIYCIKGKLINGKDFDACDMYNLMISIKESWDCKEESFMTEVKEIRKKLKDCFEKEEGWLENDKEYYFAMGQVAQYLLSKKKSTNKTHEITIRFIDAKNNEQLKKELVHLFKRYGYDISLYNKRFNLLFEMVMDYVPKSKKIDEDKLLCGLLSNSLIYEKAKTKNDKNEEV